MNNSIKKLAQAKARKSDNSDNSKPLPMQPLRRSQTASTRIPGGALNPATKVSVYKMNRETGREDLVGAAGRDTTAIGMKSKWLEQKYGHNINKVVIRDKPYNVSYVSSGRRNPAKTTPRGMR